MAQKSKAPKINSTGSHPQWSQPERKIFQKLTTPHKIQSYLDGIKYSEDPIYRTPRSVIRDQKAHCFDGALFAACALWCIGHPPLLLDLRAVEDDDHVIAIFKQQGAYGALAKSNFVGLRYREPMYRTLRELCLTYFENYYNLAKKKTLRSYSRPLDLRASCFQGWPTHEAPLEMIATRLDALPHYSLLSSKMVGQLIPVDERSYQAGMVGINRAGVYQPKKRGS